jgi:hypothetical protein
MVDVASIGRVNALYQEASTINDAIAALDNGGRIVAMQISMPRAEGAPPMRARPTIVNTAYMSYPQLMVDQIKVFFEQRLTQIDSELKALGVTGLESA